VIAAVVLLGQVLSALVSEGPALPYGIAAHAGGVVRGVPVVAGGSSWSADKTKKQWRRETFWFVEGKWKPGPPLPTPRSDLAYASDHTGLYVAGGTDVQAATREVLRLSDVGPEASWQKLPDLPAVVESAAGAILDGHLYVAGGQKSNRLWAFDGSQWQRRAPLPGGERAYAALVAHGDALYLFGGLQGTNVFSDAHRYDPKQDQWQRLTGFNLPGFGWSAVSVDDAHVMLAGRIDQKNQITDDIWLLNMPDLSVAAIGKLRVQSCCLPAVNIGANTWWFIGGEPNVQRSRTPRISVVQLER